MMNAKTNNFEAVDYASLMQRNIDLTTALKNKTELAKSVLAENAGLLLAVGDAIAMFKTFVGERGVSADQAEALTIVKTLRQAINIPTTADAIETLVSQRNIQHKNGLKEQISNSIKSHCGGELPFCDDSIHQSDRFLIGASAVLADICGQFELYQSLPEGEAA